MKSRESNVDYLFSRTSLYRVPLYQRHYVWNKKNWEQLWTDIKDKVNLRLKNGKSVKTHFTGAIVIQPDAGKLEIIDGQQRLTTFQIILCAIRDVCKVFDNDTANIVKTAHDRVLNDPTRLSRPSGSPEGDQRYKLLPRAGSDQQTFRCLVASEVAKAKKNDKSGFIYGAYVYFQDEIKTYVTQHHHKQEIVLDTLIETILKDFVVVQITADSDDDPEKIFQTINGTGRALNDFDLLRNDLFLRAGTGDERDRLYTKYWYQFEESSYWRESKIVDNFLEVFLTIKLGEDFDDQLSLFELYREYCKKLSAEMNFGELYLQLEYEFSTLNKHAAVYREIHDPNSELGSRMKFYEEFNTVFNIADALKLFMLYITNELRVLDIERTQVFDLLEAYAVRWMLCTNSSIPIKEVEGLFFDIINEKKSFSLVDLVYHLPSKELLTNQNVESALDHLLFDTPALFDTPKPTLPPRQIPKLQQSQIPKLQKKNLQYISNRIGNDSTGLLMLLKEDSLRGRFCEIWPSAEAILQSGLKKGMLPIVYSRSSTLTESRSQLERYIFMTYEGMREFVNYEIHENKIVGIDPSTNSNEKVVLDTEKILFAFPPTAMSNLRFLLFLEPIQDDVINQTLTPVPKEESYQVKDWLRLYAQTIEDSDSKHWILPDIEATAVTRAGHVLLGTLKSFNDNAIYMQIDGQVVTVYMHGLYTLDTVEMLDSKPYIFMTYDGMRKLLKHERYEDIVIGIEDSESDSNKKVVLDLKEILFAFPATTGSDLPLYHRDLPDDVKKLKLERVQKEKTFQVDDQLLKSRKQNGIYAEAITLTGHVLRGIIENYGDEAIYMLINGETVIVYRHGLLEFDWLERDNRTTIDLSVFTRYDRPIEPPIKFTTYEGQREFLQDETELYEVTRGEKIENSLPLYELDVLFAYSSKASSALEPHEIQKKLANQELPPLKKRTPWFGAKKADVMKAQTMGIPIKAVTRRGHVFKGKLEFVNPYEIYLKINGQTVVVYRHGLYSFELIT